MSPNLTWYFGLKHNNETYVANNTDANLSFTPLRVGICVNYIVYIIYRKIEIAFVFRF